MKENLHPRYYRCEVVFYLAGNALDAGQLRDEAEARACAGLPASSVTQ